MEEYNFGDTYKEGRQALLEMQERQIREDAEAESRMLAKSVQRHSEPILGLGCTRGGIIPKGTPQCIEPSSGREIALVIAIGVLVLASFLFFVFGILIGYPGILVIGVVGILALCFVVGLSKKSPS